MSNISVSSNYSTIPVYKTNDLENHRIYYKKPELYSQQLQVSKAYLRDSETNVNNDTYYFQISNTILKNIEQERNLFEFESDDLNLYKFLQRLDKHNINTINNKQESWFSNDEEGYEKLDLSDIAESYRKIFKRWNDESETFTFKSFVVPEDVKIFNSLREKIEFEKLNMNDNLTLIMEYIGIKFDNDDEFFAMFMIRSIRLNEKRSIEFDNYNFLHSDVSDEEDEQQEFDLDDEEETEENKEENTETVEETQENTETVEETEETTEENNVVVEETQPETQNSNIEEKSKKFKLKKRPNNFKLKEL
jgi:hypothetical protein